MGVSEQRRRKRSVNRNKVYFRTFCRGNIMPKEMPGIALMWLLCSPVSTLILSLQKNVYTYYSVLYTQFMFVHFVYVNVLKFFFSSWYSFRLSRLNNFFSLPRNILVYGSWPRCIFEQYISTYGDPKAKRRKNRIGLFKRMRIHRKGKEFYPMQKA